MRKNLANTPVKFVVDGNWTINESARTENDGHGIVNNVLLPEDIVDEPVATLSSAAPQSTTAALAAAVPKESDKSKEDDSIPGAFPETPAAAAETPASEYPSLSVNPIPATDGPGNPIKLAPGEPVPDPSTLTSNTIQSTVKDDKPEAETFGVAPIPATAGAGNPIHLAPGEKVPDPSTLTSNTVESTVKTDPTSYEKSDALPALPDLGLTPQAERDAKGGMFNLPPVAGNMIPESSLPMGVDAKVEQDTGIAIQSAAPTSTTAALAAQVPLEPKGVPETVTESQKEAGVAPEAAANPEAVLEKKEVEQELKDKVPEAPADADNSYTSQISEAAAPAAAAVAAGATAGAGLFAAAVVSAKDKAVEATGLNGSATGEVPEVVSDSQKAAHVSPEAAANSEAVAEKKAVESELLHEIPKTNEAGEPAPVISAATSATAPGSKVLEPALNVPDVVAESQKEAHVDPEASANRAAVSEKKAVESELLREVPKSTEAGEPAPVVVAASSATDAIPKPDEAAPNVPDVVAESEKLAHASPEAAANIEAVGEKKAVEAELLEAVKKTDAAGEAAPAIAADSTKDSAALNAPASAPAQPATSKPIDANTNVSFAAKDEPSTTEQTKPTVTTGTETTTTAPKTEATSSNATPETPKKDARKDSDVSPKGTPGSQSLASGADDKKKKRRSFFGKIKDKLSSKH